MSDKKIYSEIDLQKHLINQVELDGSYIRLLGYGMSLPFLRKLAKRIGKNHDLAISLWDFKFRDAKVLASLIGEPDKVSKTQMQKWVKDFGNWEECDQCCNNLFVYSRHAPAMAEKWKDSTALYTKRAGYVLMALLAVHDKNMQNDRFSLFLNSAPKGITDDRKEVLKGISWMIRQIGKRNPTLWKEAINLCNTLNRQDIGKGKSVITESLRELNSTQVLKKIERFNSKKGVQK